MFLRRGLAFFFLVTVARVPADARCPVSAMNQALCDPNAEDQCKDDSDCSGDSICCSTGCSKVCILHLHSACEQVKDYGERRARLLPEIEALDVIIPKCGPTGEYEEIQCERSGRCWCVDEGGRERPGTRVSSLSLVNCTNPRQCLGPQCRMLCPHDFELDEEGCPFCECRDPCKGVKCPANTECTLEEPPCKDMHCPLVPSCKQARSLESLCSIGVPLVLPETGNPYLCGNEAGKPTCPAAFKCNVQKGNDYGVCCAENMNFEKSGTCPLVVGVVEGEECKTPCRHDLECPDALKCCIANCGKTCTMPANLTLCLEQRRMAELLSMKEVAGKGYVPQCDERGEFVTRQCSRNGKVCWCVDPSGRNYPQSMGLSDSVNCSQMAKQRVSRLDEGCRNLLCPNTCDLGFKIDRNGCQTCECVENPCDSFECPSGSRCSLSNQPCDSSAKCVRTPTCLSESLYVNPCDVGTPLTDVNSGQVVTCSNTATTCPSSHICVVVSVNRAGLCCVNRPRVEFVKAGMCPFLSPSLCNGTSGLESKKCRSDKECEGDMKCCGVGGCGAICADPLLTPSPATPTPTACEYLRDARGRMVGALQPFSLAVRNPTCKENGEYEEVQCEGESCWCVDEFGAEISSTRMKKEGGLTTPMNCIEKRVAPGCLEMNCRLGCDFGYETLDGCRICECRNLCKESQCGEGEECEMVDVDCWDGHCPALPYCIPKSLSRIKCPKGEPFMDPERNESMSCNPRARMLQCPDDFYCHDTETHHDFGLCCPVLYGEEAEERSGVEDVGNSLEHTGKLGQCPYLVPLTGGSCTFDCKEDAECEDDRKCCSNGCGTTCVPPVVLTACQHMRSIIVHKARESGVPAQRIYIPQCSVDNGAFEPIQCHPVSGNCWCVNPTGEEIQGTRSLAGTIPNCQGSDNCPLKKCASDCQFGYKLDSSGCHTCECRHPCEDVKCERMSDECRLVDVSCIGEPCPPVPICLPKLENPCGYGEPLEGPMGRMTCGPTSGSCPSSHSCSLSPFREYAVCCPKPKEICFQEKETGTCDGAVTKWTFNHETNACEEFTFTGCGGNYNNFDTKEHCANVCPALTSCEKMREKKRESRDKYGHLTYIPNCAPESGDWESVQCLHEVGMCWCVDRKGEPIKGTMTKGQPICSSRQARGRLISSDPDPPVCGEGVSIHVCEPRLCEGKVCMSNPEATCRVSPCGTCKAQFFDANNQEVDCEVGLKKCQKEVQKFVNSPAWSNQGNSALIEEDAEPFLDNTLQEILIGSSMEEQDMAVARELAPLFGGNVLMRGSATILGGHGRSIDRSGTVDNIADILADIMRDERMDDEADLLDLMPSSARLLPAFNQPQFYDSSFPFRFKRSLESLEESREESGEIGEDVHVPAHSEILVSILRPNGQKKEGSCPPPKSLAVLLHLLNGDCRDECQSDEECKESFKCCMHECGFKCMEPVVSLGVVREPITKEGECPIPTEVDLSCLSHPSAFECGSDEECEGAFKCCFDGCATRCISPNREVRPAGMVASPPACDATGDFEPVQSQGELSWCVDPEGNPLPQTLTRGLVYCAKNGTVMKREARGDVCSNGREPTVCVDECLKASCSAHPTALCIADPCDMCSVAFFKQTGERVNCDEKCTQSVEPGLCRASFRQYFFNTTSSRCEEFIYGGCGGNDNNFRTIEECRADCEKPVDICKLPLKIGLCRASVDRWYYDSETDTCEEFIYGGCGGNANNFISKEQCESRCPDITLCPNMIDGELSTCSRSSACSNFSCGHLDSDEFICRVDPCTCSPLRAEDVDGREMDCSAIPTPPTIETDTGDDTIVIFADSREELATVGPSMEEKKYEMKRILSYSLDNLPLSRCLARQEKGMASCDGKGHFMPTQCSKETPPTCWCVDGSGNQIEGTGTFVRGARRCSRVSIVRVDISITFPTRVQIGEELEELIGVLASRSVTKEVTRSSLRIVEEVETKVSFSVEGSASADVGFQLEELVRRGLLADGHPAHPSSSFHSILGSKEENLVFEEAVVAAEVGKEEHDSGMLLMAVAAFSALLTIVGLFLAFRKKEKDPLPFASPLHQLEKEEKGEKEDFKAKVILKLKGILKR